MLRAAKKVVFDNVDVAAENAFIMAPVIIWNGIVLDAASAIEQKVINFFGSHGFDITKVDSDDTPLLKIVGKGKITASEVNKFLDTNNITFVIPKEKISTCVASEIYDTVQDYLQCEDTEFELIKHNQGDECTQLTGRRPIMIGRNSLRMKAGNSIANSGALICAGVTVLNAKEHNHTGISMGDMDVGIMTEIISGNDIYTKGKAFNIENTAIQSANTLVFSSKGQQAAGLTLTFDKSKTWACNPVPELHQGNGSDIIKFTMG